MKITIDTLPEGQQLVTLDIAFTEDERITCSVRMGRDDMLLSALQARMIRTSIRRLQGFLEALDDPAQQ